MSTITRLEFKNGAKKETKYSKNGAQDAKIEGTYGS